jgi:hypothetical protein
VAAEGEKESAKVDEGQSEAFASLEGAETTTDKVDEVLVEVAVVDGVKYCNLEKKSGGQCQFNISERPCPVHKAGVAEPPQKPDEHCRKPRKNGKHCNWLISVRPCPKHPSAADDAAMEAARSLLPECQEIMRSGKICLVRGCCFHAPLDLRCHSMKESNHTLRCYGFKADGSEFCDMHQEFPNLSVNMAEMLQTIPGDKLTEELFRAKYYPGEDTAFSFEFAAYVRSMRALVH